MIAALLGRKTLRWRRTIRKGPAAGNWQRTQWRSLRPGKCLTAATRVSNGLRRGSTKALGDYFLLRCLDALDNRRDIARLGLHTNVGFPVDPSSAVAPTEVRYGSRERTIPFQASAVPYAPKADHSGAPTPHEGKTATEVIGSRRIARIALWRPAPALTRARPQTIPNNHSLSGYSGATTRKSTSTRPPRRFARELTPRGLAA